MAAHRLGEPHLFYCLFDRPLGNPLVQIVPPMLSRPWIHADLRGREPPLPPPLSVRLRILPCQSVGQVHFSVALLQVLLMQLTNTVKVRRQWSSDDGRQHCSPILVSLIQLVPSRPPSSALTSCLASTTGRR